MFSVRCALHAFALAAVAACSIGCGDDEDGPPLLSRPSQDTYDCRIQRPHTRYEPTQTSSPGPSLAVTADGKAFVSHIDRTFPYPDPAPAPPALFVSPLSDDGSLGPRTLPDDEPANTWGPPGLAAFGSGLALAWTAGDELRIATTDGTGRVTHAGTPIPGVSVSDEYAYYKPRLAEGPGGKLAVAYVTDSGAGPSSELRLIVLDANLAPLGSPRVVATGSSLYAFTLIASGAGFALAWSAGDAGESGGFFATADANGAEVIAPRRFAQTGEHSPYSIGFGTLMIGFVETPSGFLAAWVEGRQSSSVIRVLALDKEGTPKGSPALLEANESAIDQVEPSLLRFGDAVAVLWAKGDHIFECGGCVPDHHIDFVLLDPETQTPLSDVVTVERQSSGPYQASGGLLSRESAVQGSNVVLTFNQQYHTTADLGSAALSCTLR